MKFSERYFKFPIKVYDLASLEKASEKEQLSGVREDAEWARGYYRCQIEDITSWHDVFTRPRSAADGCNATLVMLRDGSDIACLWGREKFEEKLSDFEQELIEFYNDSINQQEDEDASI